MIPSTRSGASIPPGRNLAAPPLAPALAAFALVLAVFALPALAAALPARARSFPFHTGYLRFENVSQEVMSPGRRAVGFDLSWDDGWRESDGRGNWDAAWVFVKYRIGDGGWRHATLSTRAGDHTHSPASPDAAEIVPSEDGVGVFVQRARDGSGTVSFEGVRLLWEAGEDGVSDGDAVDVRPLGLEMVYVPEGAFYLGDGVGGGRFHAGGDPASPCAVTADPPTLADAPGGLWAETLTVTLPGGGQGTPSWDEPTGAPTLPASWPTGVEAFYLMKTELTQGWFTTFLNMLEPEQAAVFFTPAEFMNQFPTGAARYAIAFDAGEGVYECAAPTRAANWLGWEDQIALADWAGLRPMTETELEKAARGSGQAPVPGEYCWGTTRLQTVTGVSGVDGSGSETPLPADANTLVDRSVSGPVRAGIHAGKAPDRDRSGGGYCGALDLTGNVIESVVTLGSESGRRFTGAHGDGELDASGAANTPLWPRAVYTGYFGLPGNEDERLWPWLEWPPAPEPPFDGIENGYGAKCGDWMNQGEDLLASRLSDRRWATYPTARRLPGYGFRGVRSAPAPAPASKRPEARWLAF